MLGAVAQSWLLDRGKWGVEAQIIEAPNELCIGHRFDRREPAVLWAESMRKTWKPGDSRGRKAMNWREHVRAIALIVNGLFVVALIGSRSWFVSPGFGVPMVVPPVLAVISLAVSRPRPAR